MPKVIIEGPALVSFDGFHDAFADAFGFGDRYGRDLDAWIECMSDLALRELRETQDDPLSVVVVAAHASAQDVLDALVDCTAAANRRRAEAGDLAPIHLHIKRR